LAKLTQSNDVKFLYTIPNYQNPTGLRHSEASRRKTASVIKASNTFIIEDDPYGEIRFEGEQLPTLHALLPQQTILLGSFSKMVAPGLRIGWVIASADIIRHLTILKQASDLHSSHLDQQILFDYLTHYSLDDHIASIRDLYEKRRDAMLQSLYKYFPETITYTKPNGGMFLWLTFPLHFNTMNLLKKSIEKGILFVPGETFYSAKLEFNKARFNFSNTEEGKIEMAIAQLGALIKEDYEN
jgi:2-aminoadipate transaminase